MAKVTPGLQSHRSTWNLAGQRYNCHVRSLDQTPSPTIVESFFELRQLHSTNWIELWGKTPNPFLTAILPATESLGVDLADISFNANPASLGEIAFNVLLKKLRAALKLTLSNVTFLAENPDWEDAPKFLEVFQDLAARIQAVAGQLPNSQECSLAFHIAPGPHDFGRATKSFVREDVIAPGDFYGLTRHRADCAMTIDKSMKYANGAFVRLQRTFAGDVPFTQIAIALFEDEKEALKLLGINEVPQ